MAVGMSLEELLDASPIRREHIRVWLLSAMGIMLDGFDFFIMGVAIPLIKVQFNPSALEIGLVSASAVLGAMVGAVTIGRLTDRIGRKLVFKIDLAIFVVFALLSALAPNIWALFLFRFCLGIGVGADYPISSSYVAEIAPDKHRSRLLVGAFSFQAVGQLLGVVVGIVVLNLYPEPNAWRYMLAFGVVPAAIIVFLRRGVPESPRWLATRGELDEAARVAEVFLHEPVTAAQVTAYATTDQAGEAQPLSFKALFSQRLRRKTTLTTIPWFLMDIATYGIGVFTPTIIAAVGIGAATANSNYIADDIVSAEGAAFVDVFLIVGFGLALLLINRVGHIRLQIAGFVAMAAGLLLLAYVSSLPGGGNQHVALVFGGFIVFNLFMNMGPNATTYVLPAEVFPTQLRASGSGLAASCGKAGAALGLIVFPVLQTSLGLPWTLAIIAAGCVVAAFVTAVLRAEVSRVGCHGDGARPEPHGGTQRRAVGAGQRIR
ncbi:MAG: MFS transporter [Actinobacteria bacterium]|nr:MFS transporter [Actinomycetota bacterium]